MNPDRPAPELSPEELRQVEAFAEELRAAHPAPPLSPEFSARLAELHQPRWTFGRALQQNRLLRVAAGLLVTVAGSVPVMAVLQLLSAPADDQPWVHFDPPRTSPAVEVPVAPELPAPPAPADDLADSLDESFVVAVDRQSRMNRASFRWHQAYPVDAPVPAFDPGAGAPAGLSAGLALRCGLVTPEQLSVPADWAQSSPEQVWLELERLLASEHPLAPSGPLVTRIRQLWNGDPSSRPWLAGWIWVLDGERDPALGQLPAGVGADLQVSWEAADRSSLVWPAD